MTCDEVRALKGKLGPVSLTRSLLVAVTTHLHACPACDAWARNANEEVCSRWPTEVQDKAAAMIQKVYDECLAADDPELPKMPTEPPPLPPPLDGKVTCEYIVAMGGRGQPSAEVEEKCVRHVENCPNCLAMLQEHSYQLDTAEALQALPELWLYMTLLRHGFVGGLGETDDLR